MAKQKFIIGLGVAIILTETLGFTDGMKVYIITAFALLITLLSLWQYSESREK